MVRDANRDNKEIIPDKARTGNRRVSRVKVARAGNRQVSRVKTARADKGRVVSGAQDWAMEVTEEAIATVIQVRAPTTGASIGEITPRREVLPSSLTILPSRRSVLIRTVCAIWINFARRFGEILRWRAKFRI